MMQQHGNARWLKETEENSPHLNRKNVGQLVQKNCLTGMPETIYYLWERSSFQRVLLAVFFLFWSTPMQEPPCIL